MEGPSCQASSLTSLVPAPENPNQYGLTCGTKALVRDNEGVNCSGFRKNGKMFKALPGMPTQLPDFQLRSNDCGGPIGQIQAFDYWAAEEELKCKGYKAEDFGCRELGFVKDWGTWWSCKFLKMRDGQIYKMTGDRMYADGDSFDWPIVMADADFNAAECCTSTSPDPWKCFNVCPADPEGLCTLTMQDTCQAIDESCHKSKMLVPGSACQTWYQSWLLRGNGEPLQELIAQYCEKNPAQGECACYNFTANAGGRAAIQGYGKPSFDGKQQGMVRQDAYCVPGTGQTAEFKKNSPEAWQEFCADQGKKPMSPVANEIPAGIPPHCWAADCQGNADECLFYDPRQMDQKCPSMCLQVSSGNKISAGTNVRGMSGFTIDGMSGSCSFGDQKQEIGTCFTVDDPDFEADYTVFVPPKAKLTRYLNLKNLADDTKFPKYGEVSWSAYSSIPSVLKLEQSEGVLPNAGKASVQVTIDASSQSEGDNFPAEIVVMDANGLNEPLRVLVAVYVTSLPQQGNADMPKQPSQNPSRISVGDAGGGRGRAADATLVAGIGILLAGVIGAAL